MCPTYEKRHASGGISMAAKISMILAAVKPDPKLHSSGEPELGE